MSIKEVEAIDLTDVYGDADELTQAFPAAPALPRVPRVSRTLRPTVPDVSFGVAERPLDAAIRSSVPPGIRETSASFEPPARIGLAGDAATRKASPIASGLLFYFPNACAAVAALSKIGNDQHNPGQAMHWNFTKSTDEADCILRHEADAGTVDTDGVRHSTKVAWRALAQLERELLAAHPELQPGKNVKGFTR